jgi:hypothetical protein
MVFFLLDVSFCAILDLFDGFFNEGGDQHKKACTRRVIIKGE